MVFIFFPINLIVSKVFVDFNFLINLKQFLDLMLIIDVKLHVQNPSHCINLSKHHATSNIILCSLFLCTLYRIKTH